jgi:carboxypeptidase PM20D1
VLARALLRISKKPFPFKLIPTVESFFSKLSELASGPQAFFMRHARLLGPLFFLAVGGSPDIASMLRTTVAITQLEGSSADNVMPSAVRAVINTRLLWPWTVESVIARVKKIVNDERVKISVYGLGTNPVPAGSGYAKLSGPGWKEMREAMEKVYPGIPILPFLMVATTDSRHYEKLAEGIFRFNPVKLNPQELSLIHGHDERISLENLKGGAEFYAALFSLL